MVVVYAAEGMPKVATKNKSMASKYGGNWTGVRKGDKPNHFVSCDWKWKWRGQPDKIRCERTIIRNERVRIEINRQMSHLVSQSGENRRTIKRTKWREETGAIRNRQENALQLCSREKKWLCVRIRLNEVKKRKVSGRVRSMQEQGGRPNQNETIILDNNEVQTNLKGN